MSCLFAFSYCSWGSQDKILKQFALPFFSGHFLRTLHHDPSVLGGPTQTCPRVSRSLQWWHGLGVACYKVGGTGCSSMCIGPLQGGRHYLHCLHHSLVQVNNREGTQHHTLTENWIKDLLSMTLPISTRPSFPLSQFLPSGSFLSLLPFSIRGQMD